MSVATLMPRPTRRGRRTWKPRAPLAVRVRRLPDRLPEVRVVTREDAGARQPGDRLQLLDRVECLRRVPDDAGNPFLIDVLLPVAGVGGQDDRPGVWQLAEQRGVPRRGAVGAQRSHAGRELAVAVQEPPAVAPALEVLAVAEAAGAGGRPGRGRVRVPR